MPSFDIESKIDNHELSNAIDQTNRVITNRYDLKDANANVDLQENEIKVLQLPYFINYNPQSNFYFANVLMSLLNSW